MEEQNKQTLENQETNAQEPPAAPQTKAKKRISKKMIVILASTFVLILAAVLFFVFGDVSFRCVLLNHDYYSYVSQEASCSKPGITRFVCPHCHDRSYEESIPALGGECDWQPATCQNPKTCRKCGITEGDVVDHDWAPATCTEYEKCKACGTINLDSETLEHEWLPATCAEDSYCKLCLKIAWDSKIPHTYSTTDGTCTVCGAGVKLIVPATPKTISYYSTSICKIENISIKRIDGYTDRYEITFLVESIYHKNGNSYSDSACFGWKLYDEDGVVVDSGTGYTDNIMVGEKSREVLTFYIGNDSSYLQDGKTYRLELLDIG